MRSTFCTVAIVTLLWLVTFPVAATAQTDAEIALQDARAAFANEQFESARDLLETASQTDADNPDVFLLLGKAHYQLGDVDAAIKAWNQTLNLAPAQAYARRMVEALQKKIRDADVRLQILETLVTDRQYQLALSQILSIKRDALTTPQLVELLALEAEIQIGLGNGGAALKALRELAVRDPAQAATPRTRLLTGKAKLAIDSDSIDEGLAMLTAVETEFGETAEGVAAELALISFRVDQGEDAIADLAAWITANGQHADVRDARQTMIRAVYVFLQVAARLPKPEQDDALSAAESSALVAAEHALSSTKNADDSLNLTQQLVAHFQKRWIANKSYDVPVAAFQRLLQLEISTASRTELEKALVQSADAAASEELDNLVLAIEEGDALPDVLANWIQTHQQHPRLEPARVKLVSAYLDQSRRHGIPDADSDLSDSDIAAFAVAAGLLDVMQTTAERTQLIQDLLLHLQTHYTAHGVTAAAIKGQQSLLEMPLQKRIRFLVLTALADTQTTAAMSRLKKEVAAGTLKGGNLPADLAVAMQTFQLITREFPAQPCWQKQATVGARIAALSSRIPLPATVTQIQATDAWALDFVLPVIAADHAVASTDAATNVVNSIVDRANAIKQRSARGLASATHQKLLDVLPEENVNWPAAVLRQLDLRIADDKLVFLENIDTGRGQLNADLSEDHKSMLALASKLIAREPNKSAAVLAALEPFLSRRTQVGYDAVVQEAYALLEASLPPRQLRNAQLAVAQSWVNQVLAKHSKLLNNGFQPPEKLDEQLEKTLVRCYELQFGLGQTNEFVHAVRRLRTSVIAHYRNLRYHETAAAAIGVKAEQQVEWLDALADFELAGLRLSLALTDLDDQTGKFEGRENITLTPAVNEAIAGLEQFITGRPTHRLVPDVVAKVLSVGKRYEQYEKYDIAAEIYTRLETFASENESLQHAEPDKPTIAEQAAYAVAAALHVKASKALDEQVKDRPDRDDPPGELSNEFREAIAAYQAIVTKYADSPLVSRAIGKTMEIALEYANVGSWDVADSVYENLAAQQLPLRQPERLDFARALCELGKVIPDHARQVLAVVTLWEREVRTPDDDVSKIAGNINRAPTMVGDLFGGGAGGFGSMAMEPMAGNPSDGAGIASATPSLPENGQPTDPFGDLAAASRLAESSDMFHAEAERAERETDLLAAVRRQQSALATQVAMLRDNEIQHVELQTVANQQGQQQAELPVQAPLVPVLSEAEIARRQTILDVAYTKLQAIRRAYADSTTADQAREQIMVIVNHWRSIKQWERSANLVKRFLTDNPADIELPQLRLGVARDYLAWAAGTVEPHKPKQELLDEVNQRFALARDELSGIIAAFPDDEALTHQAQWDIAGSHLSQARVVAGFSSTLARGQFVRAANELLETADLYHDHPKVTEIPNMLWSIAQELTGRHFYDEAITVWNEMTLHYPGNPLAEQVALQIAQTYQNQLQLPLRAVEAYLELNFARGGSDAALQDAIFQIATGLKNKKRWVESLHVLETFVDSFPNHASAGQALTMIGQVHQTNEVWEDAILAYRRVILEYDQGDWAQQSKWSIAECTINLSRWEEAQGAYREYQKAYPADPKVAEATSRLEILKDLARFQRVADEDGQRKAFDAQYQIGTIVRSKLANPVKSIIEYKKVADRWPDSHLADDALFQVGMIYMELGQTEDARDAFFATAEQYPTSPLADDALFQVGASFENEAQVLAGVTRGKAIAIANEVAQKQAYVVSQDNRKMQRVKTLGQIVQLKKEGKSAEADRQTAFQAALNVAFDQANAAVVSNWAAQQEAALTTAQLADRQDKINAALRKAVTSFRSAASVASADKADDALLRMAQIYDQRLKDSNAAMSTWLEIVKQYSGTTVAEDASWKIAQYYETHEKYADAISAYNSFLRNYRRSPKASDAQAAIAENHEQLGNWVEAMDAYTNYINNYPQGTMASKAREQIAWIKTYRL